MGCGLAGSPSLVPRFLRTWNQNSSFFSCRKFWSAAPTMVGSEESVDPSLFMNVFMPLFRPQGEENINQQEGMYYDRA